jgi:predicted ribosomally synthesized peptide with SipW-like signal peptide
MKKILLSALSMITVAALAITGTVAWLQDEKSDVNMMTVGNVSIAQHEYERVVENDTYKIGTFDEQTSYVLQEFTQNKPLYPIVGDPSTGAAGWDDTTVRMSQVKSYGGMQVFAGKNAQDKFVTVENTGKTDAFVRTLVAIEVGEADADLVGISYHNAWTKNELGEITVEGNRYYLYEFVYAGGQLSDGTWRHEKGILPAGDTSYPSLAQVYIKSVATNEDMEKLDGNDDGNIEILVLSQAVQAAGFSDAESALNAAYGEITPDKHPFPTVIYIRSNDEAKLLSAMATDAKVIIQTDIVDVTLPVFDGKGEKLFLDGIGKGRYGYLAFRRGKGIDAKVENLTVTGSGFVEVGHHENGGGTYNINNLVIQDLNATLALTTEGIDKFAAAFAHYGTATLTNCVMTGTTASTEGWKDYAYDISFVNTTKSIVEGGVYGAAYVQSQAHVTFKNAKVGKIDTCAITTNNLGKVTVGAGTTVDTITVTPSIHSYKTALVVEAGATVGTIDLSNVKQTGGITIEEGASIGAFIDNGVSYATFDQWKAAQ